MVFSERVLSITQDKLLPAVVDAILNSNILTVRTMARGSKVWSGETLKKAVKVSKSTTGGSFDGVDEFNITAQSTRIRLSFEPKGFYQNVTIIGIEKAVNQTDAQVVNLVKVSLEEAKDDAMDSIGTIFYGLGTGKDFEGLGEIVDDTTDTSTYGGQSRTTYPQLNATRTASGGALTLTLMGNLMNSCSASGSERQRPTLGVTTETVWNLYEKLLTPTVAANYNALGYPQVTAMTRPGSVSRGEDALAGTQGFNAITFRGMPIVSDEKCTSQNLFFLNENYLDWYRLTSSDLQAISLGGEIVDGVYQEYKIPSPFQWTGFKVPVSQFAEAGQLIALGNLVSWNPRRHGRLTGITTS
jgi:hypothetical protein